MAYALAIDIGSSSLRAALIDAEGAVVPGTLAQYDVQLSGGDGGVAQIEAMSLRERVERAIDATLASSAAAGREIVVVGMTTFWHSLVALSPDGVPSTPALSWADTRSEADALALRRRLDAEAVRQRTGCALHPSYLPAKLHWLRGHQPDLFVPGAMFVAFAQYCTGVWLGSRTSSVSMASGSGLLDSARCAWDAELLDTLAINVASLGDLADDPELLPPVTDDYARRWPALAGVPWRAPIGDGVASNIGSGAVGQNRLALMIGTSGALRRCERGAPNAMLPHGLWRYRLDRGYLVPGGALSDGGNAHAWLRDTLKLPSDAVVEEELARRAPGEHGMVVLPFWSGERSTGWVGDATAIFAGIRRHSTALDIYQAAIEAITYRFALILDLLVSDATERPVLIATGGGLLASPAWLQLLADVTGQRVVASRVEEASLRGAALVALRDVGVLTDGAFTMAPFGAEVLPRPDRYETHRRAIARQQELYAREVGPDGVYLLARQTR